MRNIAIEFSNILTDNERHPLDILNREIFYELKHDDGFIKTKHFTEFPLWVNHIAGIVPNLEFHICYSFKDTFSYLNEITEETLLFFSYIESTQSYITYLIEQLSTKSDVFTYIVGGGVGSRISLSENKKVITVQSIQEFTKLFGFVNKYILRAFSDNEKYIPRINTTIGCKNNCSFCKKDKYFKVMTHEESLSNIRIANSKLIYVGNKTFGQGGLSELTRLENFYTTNFIVQTTIRQIYDNQDDLHLWKDHKIKYIELGVESLVPSSIKRLGKNYTLAELNKVLELLNKYNIKPILNFMVGIPNETVKDFNETILKLQMLIESNYIYSINIFNYTDYNAKDKVDRDERQIIKSWNLSKADDVFYYFSELCRINYNLLIK